VFSIYGKELLKPMRFSPAVPKGVDGGVCGIGDSARGNRSHQSFFINGRYMKSQLLSNALEQGCRERVTIGHFPTCVLHLKMPLEAVDVNVHPNKLEVRFQNENGVFEGLRDLIQEALAKDEALRNIPEMELNPEKEGTYPFPNQVVMQEKVSNSTESGINIPNSISTDSIVYDIIPKSDLALL
jgi:DNA mismatch repair protein MutL